MPAFLSVDPSQDGLSLPSKSLQVGAGLSSDGGVLGIHHKGTSAI